MQFIQTALRAPFSRPSSAKVTSDEALVALIANSNKDAIRVLFARHNVRLFRFLLRIVGNDATAAELVNEVFIDVWRNAGRFEARSQVTTWILAIARYKALAALRRRPYDELADDAREMIKDQADDPETAVQQTERGALLQAYLKRLSVAHREVIDLVHYHERSIDEVAHIMGVLSGLPRQRCRGLH
jgi:RNA polymerase sigma-70 factor (ECF subfamily)